MKYSITDKVYYENDEKNLNIKREDFEKMIREIPSTSQRGLLMVAMTTGKKEFTVHDLKVYCKEHEVSIRRHLHGLVERGYVKRVMVKDSDGSAKTC